MNLQAIQDEFERSIKNKQGKKETWKDAIVNLLVQLGVLSNMLGREGYSKYAAKETIGNMLLCLVYLCSIKRISLEDCVKAALYDYNVSLPVETHRAMQYAEAERCLQFTKDTILHRSDDGSFEFATIWGILHGVSNGCRMDDLLTDSQKAAEAEWNKLNKSVTGEGK